MKNFSLSLTTKTLTITKAFEDAVATGKGNEYETYKRLMEDIPDLKVIRKTHASPRKYVNKQGEQFNCNQFKNITLINYIIVCWIYKIHWNNSVIYKVCLMNAGE